MSFELQFLGATGRVTGSLYVARIDGHTVLLECGLIQGRRDEESANRKPFPFDVDDIDAVVLSHAHIDHSGRLPLLFKQGYAGPIYTQNASKTLCSIMLPDSGYLNEKDAEWENRRRREKNEPLLEPLYTREDAEACMTLFEGLKYDTPREILPGVTLTLRDAGHILGSAIVELTATASGRTLVFSGDLGYRDAPVMDSPAVIKSADVVLMESTYGDRNHRAFSETIDELSNVFKAARAGQGNILIPAFTVGRTQDLLYLMAEHYDEWSLDDWNIYLDSPMGIEATKAYGRYRHLYGARLFGPDSHLPDLPNFHMTRTTEESMTINDIRSGAIIIAGSGMCTGGRIHHHLKNNIWRPECHLVIVGYQAQGTLGRRLVDGVEKVRLWGDSYAVRARIHTIGGLSAHADQQDLLDWYGAFESRPPVYLVHGESRGQEPLAAALRSRFGANAVIADYGQKVSVG